MSFKKFKSVYEFKSVYKTGSGTKLKNEINFKN